MRGQRITPSSACLLALPIRLVSFAFQLHGHKCRRVFAAVATEASAGAGCGTRTKPPLREGSDHRADPLDAVSGRPGRLASACSPQMRILGSGSCTRATAAISRATLTAYSEPTGSEGGAGERIGCIRWCSKNRASKFG